MLTVQALKEHGADVEDGLTRCMNNEAFYIRLVGMALNDGAYESLGEAIKAGDTRAAFEEAHKLKGMLANLSLTPVLDPVSQLTEILRNDSEGDREGLYAQLMQQRDALKALVNG